MRKFKIKKIIEKSVKIIILAITLLKFWVKTSQNKKLMWVWILKK